MSTASQEWRRSWRVVAGSSIGIASGLSVWSFVVSSFVEPQQRAFGWSRGDMALAFNASIVAAFLSPLAGRLTDQFGVRPVLLAAMILLGLDYIAMANMNGSLALYYVLYSVQTVIGLGTTGITFARAVTSWFEASRGLALAGSRIGLGAIGGALPLLVYGAVDRFGWQGGYYAMAALALGVGLPVSWFLVHERQATPMPVSPNSAGREKGLRFWLDLVTDWRVVALCLAGGLTYGPLIGILGQLQPILTDRGIEAATAAELRGMLAVAVFAATVLTGFFLDRFWAPLVACLATLGPVLGCLLLAGAQSTLGLGVAILLIGFAQGAEINILAYLTARYFGMRAYSTIYGLNVMTISLFSAAGGALFGQAYDRFGDYREVLMVGAGCFALSALCYLAMGRYPAEPDVTAPQPA